MGTRSFNFIPTTSTVVLRFDGVSTWWDHDLIYLDNVRVGGDCNDSDGDGILNKFDLDSDNDGIYDAVEAGHNQSNTGGVLSGSVGSDGIPDSAQAAGQENSGTINYTILDSDSDTNYDFIEIDSDGDGCNDVTEAGFTENGSSGRLNGSGTNTDGLVTGNADGYTTPADIDTNSIYDYREVGTSPTITTQPTTQNVPDGGNANFMVSATGSGLTYQWQVSTDNGASFVNMPGETSSNLMLAGVTASDSGNLYRVNVTDGSFVCGFSVSFTAALYISADSDGDGVVDLVDLDDDNDGIFDYDELATCSATDPVVTNTIFVENFGTQSTANGTPSVSSPYTNYTYFEAVVGTPAPPWPGGLNDGRYTIFNDIQYTADWAPSIWQSIGDHTDGSATPTGGRMAIFNADNTPNLEFYRRVLNNVDINAPVDFSFWVMNIDIDDPVNAGRPEPNLTITFEQNGLPIYTMVTGTIPREADGDINAWKNFTGSFQPTSSDPIEIVMVNNVVGGGGNDLALDDIVLTQSFCDSDGDGIVNTLEVDSDNDGCYDVVEAGFTDPDGDGFLGISPVTIVTDGSGNGDGTVVWTDGYTTPADGDANGIYDFTEAGGVPSISVQPANRVAYAGGNIDFTITSTADAFQWQISTDGGVTFTNVSDGAQYSGTNTNTLLINSTSINMNSYEYRVVTSNSNYVCGSVISDPASLLVRVRTVITNRQITYRVNKN